MERVSLLRNTVVPGKGTYTYITILNDYVDHIDHCLLTGFSNVSGSQLEWLKSIIRIFNNTPLQAMLADSIDSLTNNIFSRELFLSIAVIRNTLLTLKYNVLVTSGKESPAGDSDEISFSDELMKQEDNSTVQDTISSWLTELAITGFKNIIEEKLTGIFKTITIIAGKKELAWQARLHLLPALLTAFLKAACQMHPVFH